MTVRHACGDAPDACMCVYDSECNDELVTRRMVVLDEVVAAMREYEGTTETPHADFLAARFGG